MSFLLGLWLLSRIKIRLRPILDTIVEDEQEFPGPFANDN